MVTGSEDGTARVWRLEDGKLLTVLHGHRAGTTPPRADVLGSVWVDDQRLTTAGRDGSLRLWHVFDDEGKPVCQAEDGLAACEEHSRRLAGGEEGFGWIDSARWIDVATIVYTGVASDGTLFAGRESQDPNSRWLWRDDSDHPADLAWSPSGRYLLLRKQAEFNVPDEEMFDSAVVIDVATSPGVTQLVGPLAWADWVANEQDADLLLVSRLSGDELIDVAQDRTWTLPKPSGYQAVVSAAQSHGDRLAVGRANGAVYVWNYETDSIEDVFVPELATFASRVVDLRWDAPGKQLLIVCYTRVALWNSTKVDTLPQEVPLSRVTDAPGFAEFSPDGRWIAVSVGEQLLVFDASTGNEVVRNRAHQDTIQGIQWMRAANWPDQKTTSSLPFWKSGTSESDRLLLLSWSGDGTARLWHLDTRSDPERLIEIWQVNDVDQVGHRSFRAGAISPDQSQILTVNNDGVVRIWKTWVNDPKELIRLVKELRDQANQEGRLP